LNIIRKKYNLKPAISSKPLKTSNKVS